MNRIRPPQPVHASAGLAHNSVTAPPHPTRRGEAARPLSLKGEGFKLLKSVQSWPLALQGEGLPGSDGTMGVRSRRDGVVREACWRVASGSVTPRTDSVTPRTDTAIRRTEMAAASTPHHPRRRHTITINPTVTAGQRMKNIPAFASR